MHKDGDQIHETADEARDAVDVPGMTLVLGISLGLAIVILSAIWIFWVR
ncbi:hypothetical protein SPAN111604_04885 [Sphingomonas antarctica]